MDHISGKSVVITGAASGFGRLLASKAAARGARVTGGDIAVNELNALVNDVAEAGGEAQGIETDVTDLAAMQRLVAAAVDRYGAVDVMVNNAGIMPLAFFSDHASAGDAWSRCIDINIKGVLNGIVAVYDTMLAQGRGHVVNLSSIYGNFPVAGAGVYGASKAAVDFLSASLRVEAQGRIKVTNVKPTGVPGTNLANGVVNPEAIVGILGQYAPAYMQQLQGLATGEAPVELVDSEHIEYAALAPEHLAEQILYAIDQPWGVNIAELTVRASGDAYIL